MRADPRAGAGGASSRALVETQWRALQAAGQALPPGGPVDERTERRFVDVLLAFLVAVVRWERVAPETDPLLTELRAARRNPEVRRLGWRAIPTLNHNLAQLRRRFEERVAWSTPEAEGALLGLADARGVWLWLGLDSRFSWWIDELAASVDALPEAWVDVDADTLAEPQGAVAALVRSIRLSSERAGVSWGPLDPADGVLEWGRQLRGMGRAGRDGVRLGAFALIDVRADDHTLLIGADAYEARPAEPGSPAWNRLLLTVPLLQRSPTGVLRADPLGIVSILAEHSALVPLGAERGAHTSEFPVWAPGTLLDGTGLPHRIDLPAPAGLHPAPRVCVLVRGLSPNRLGHADPRPASSLAPEAQGSPRSLANWCTLARGVAAQLVEGHRRQDPNGFPRAEVAHGRVGVEDVLVRVDEDGAWRDPLLVGWRDRGAEGQGGAIQLAPVVRDVRKLGQSLLETLPAGPDASPAVRVAREACERYLLVRPEDVTTRDRRSIGRLGGFAGELDRVVHATIRAGRDPLTGSAARIGALAAQGTMAEWARRYVRPRGELSDTRPARSVAEARARLKAGNGVAAREDLDGLLDGWIADPATRPADPDEIARALRLHLVLSLRERRDAEAERRALRFSDGDAPVLLRAWVDLLVDRARVRSTSSEPPRAGRWEAEVRDPRWHAWWRVLQHQRQLRDPRAGRWPEPREVARAVDDAATRHESAFGALMLARAFASRAESGDLERALGALYQAAILATDGELPHELAAAAGLCARLVADALRSEKPSLPVGADGRELARAAADAGTWAAYGYALLGAATDAASAAAAAFACAGAPADPDSVVAAMRWRSYGRLLHEAGTPDAPLPTSLSVRSDPSSALPLARGGRGGTPAPLQRYTGDPAAAYARRISRAYVGTIAAICGRSGGTSIDEPAGSEASLLFRSLEASGLAPGSRVLDLGCGYGADVAALARAGHVVVGVDSVPHFVDCARARVRDERAAFVDCDVTAADEDGGDERLAAGSFELVLAREALSAVGARHRALMWARTRLRPGGVLVILDWFVRSRPGGPDRAPSPDAWVRLHDGALRHELDTLNVWRRRLERAGFMDSLVVRDETLTLERFLAALDRPRSPAAASLAALDGRTLARTVEVLRGMRWAVGQGLLGYVCLVARSPGGGAQVFSLA